MAKIINFPNLNKTTESFMQESTELMKKHEVENLIIAGKTKDGNMVIGYYKCDFGTRQEICSHIQVDIVDWIIRNS